MRATIYDPRNRRIYTPIQRPYSTVAPPSLPVGTQEWRPLKTHTFAWGGNNIGLKMVVSADDTTRMCEYFWGPDLSGTLQGAGGVGGLVAVSIGEHFCFPIYDNNGSVVKYSDEMGNVVAAYEHDDFGRAISQDGSFRHRFSTKYHDPETGLYCYGYRFYSPALMRWLNRDPIGEDGGVNLYAFCKNCPTTYVDIMGCGLDDYLPFLSTILAAIEGYLGHIPGSSTIDYSFVSPQDCKCNPSQAEILCEKKVKEEALQYVSSVLSSAAIARVTDFVVAIATVRADPRVSAAFFADGTLGTAINARAYAKIMEGARNARAKNCSCSQYGY